MKKVIILAVLVAIFVLATANTALADVTWTFAYRNNTTATADDLHVWVYQDESMTVPLSVSTATVINPADWTASTTATNEIYMFAGTPVSPGGTVWFRFTTPYPPTGAVFTKAGWTKGGTFINDPAFPDVVESNKPIEVAAQVPRAIRLTVSPNFDLGPVIPGRTGSASMSVSVKSNADWDLYVGAEDVPGFGSMLGHARIGTAFGQVGGTAWWDLGVPNDPIQMVTQQSPGPAGDSFFDVFYEFTPDYAVTPGSYKILLNMNAVQNY